MAHTPGPWYWEKRGNTYRLFTPKNGSCTVMDFTRMGMQHAQPRFSDRAGAPLGGVMINAEKIENLGTHPDARLIAAAPELLNACNNALAVLTSVQMEYLPGRNADVDAAVRMLIATIANSSEAVK